MSVVLHVLFPFDGKNLYVNPANMFSGEYFKFVVEFACSNCDNSKCIEIVLYFLTLSKFVY